MAEYAYKLRNKKTKEFFKSNNRTSKNGAIYNTPPQRRWPVDNYRGDDMTVDDWEIVKYLLVEIVPDDQIIKDGTEEHGQ